MFITSLFTCEARGEDGGGEGGGGKFASERNKEDEYLSRPLPPHSQVFRFALASSSFTILSSRLTIESKYEKIESCEQSKGRNEIKEN